MRDLEGELDHTTLENICSEGRASETECHVILKRYLVNKVDLDRSVT